MDFTLKCILAFFAFWLGGIFASFMGVVAYRVPKKQSIVKPDSYCPNCNKNVAWYDNIPIVSYIVLGGKCRHCKSPIGGHCFATELLCSVAFALSFWQYEISWHTLILWLCFTLFVVIAYIDWESHDIYNVTLLLFGVIAVATCVYNVLVYGYSVWTYVIGLVIGVVFFGGVKLGAWLILKKDALGTGDVYLVAIAGLMLGAVPLLLAVVVATLVGSVVEVIRTKVSKLEEGREVAFGPYLILGFAVMAIYGQAIVDWYTKVVL